MTTGIYSIYFESIDKIYIGQSQNIEQRFTAHKSLLSRGHYNYKLANAYKLDKNPVFTILVETSIDELNTTEINLINEFDSINNGLNIHHGGRAGLPGYSSGKCKNTKEELELAFNLLCDPSLTKYQISEMSGVSLETITNIICKKRHIWLHEYYPQTSLIVQSLKSIRASNAQENRFKTNVYLLSPEGIEYHCSNRTKFAIEHNLNAGHLGCVIRKEESQHKGWKLIDKEVNK